MSLKSLVCDVSFLTVVCPSGVCCVHQREGALHSHPQDDGRGEGVRGHRARSERPENWIWLEI